MICYEMLKHFKNHVRRKCRREEYSPRNDICFGHLFFYNSSDEEKLEMGAEYSALIFAGHHYCLWFAASAHRLLLGRLAICLDGKISWSRGIHSSIRRSPPFFGTHLFCDDELNSPRSSLLADLCSRHSFPCCTFSLVRAKANLAPSQATNFPCIAALLSVSRL